MAQRPGAEALRPLTDAVIAVGAGLELDVVLQRLVTTAATLSGARYSALGVTDGEGRIVQFVTHGIGPELRERLGGAPGAHGIPGLLLRPDATAVRLSELGRHPGSVGFPAGHPRMQTFLGVPVRVSGRIFGNLYVAEKQPDPRTPGAPALFTADDEEALLALGAAAGVAVENARLFAAVRHQRCWSDAVGEAIASIVERSELDTRTRLDRLPAIARRAGQAELGLLAVPDAEGVWHVRYADPASGCVPDRRDGEAALAAVAAASGGMAEVTELGPKELVALPGGWAAGLVVPVGGARGPAAPAGPAGVEAAVVLAYRTAPGPGLRPADRAAERDFGERVGLALQVAQAQADSAALRLLRDRDRIARDLHDLVIQRLFAVGLSLQAAGVAARVPEVKQRLGGAVDEIDEIIKDVRRTIFELHGADVRSALRERLVRIVDAARDALPDDVELVVSGALDGLPEDVAAAAVAVLREGLTNVARHAAATSVRVYVTVGAQLEVEVVDDGRGIAPGSAHGQGLPNLAERAAALGGTFELDPGPDGGTVLRWSVPLPTG